MNCEAGVSPQTAKPQHELVLIERGCQGQSEDFFAQKKGRAAETHAGHTCGRGLATHANEHCDGRSFDAIFNALDGEAAPGLSDSGVRDISRKRHGFGARRASRGEEGVHLILAKSSMASATSARREDSGRPEARLRIERTFSHTNCFAHGCCHILSK